MYYCPGFEDIESFVIKTTERSYSLDTEFIKGLYTNDNELKVVLDIHPGFEKFLLMLVQLPEFEPLNVEVVWRSLSGTARVSFNVFACNLEYSWSQGTEFLGIILFESEDPNFSIKFDCAEHSKRDYYKEI
jgi:hypothetical protein